MVKISVCMVVYNEEKVIARCLDSLKGIFDEMIIVMDGKSTDNTYNIIKNYTDKIYIVNHLGEAEPHKIYSWSKARNNWIFEIDADEYITKGLIKFLRNFKESKGVDGYKFIWKQWWGNIPFKSNYFLREGKTALFRKDRVIGNDRELRVPLRLKGKTKILNYIIEHIPSTNKYNFSVIKLKKYRAYLRAKHYLKVGIPNFPRLLYIPKSFVVYLITIFNAIRKGCLMEGYRGFIYVIIHGLTIFYTQIYFFKLTGRNAEKVDIEMTQLGRSLKR